MITQERERGFQQQIEELRTDNADGYNKCKIALEKGIQEQSRYHSVQLVVFSTVDDTRSVTDETSRDGSNTGDDLRSVVDIYT